MSESRVRDDDDERPPPWLSGEGRWALATVIMVVAILCLASLVIIFWYLSSLLTGHA
jgi:hypothetical protein